MQKPPKIALESTRINSLHFRVRDDVEIKEVEIPIRFRISCRSDYNYKEKKIFAVIQVSLEEGDLPFVLDIEYHGQFTLNKRTAKKKIEPFAAVNCPAILFPFLRESVADITRRAGFSPLILPAINFVELAKNRDSAVKKK